MGTVRLYAENEIKENFGNGDGGTDSSSEYNSEYNSDFLSPLVDRDEELISFDIIDEMEEREEEKEENKKTIMENNDKYKPEAVSGGGVKKTKKMKKKIDIFDAIPGYFDEFVSLFDKNHKKKTRRDRKRYTTTATDAI